MFKIKWNGLLKKKRKEKKSNDKKKKTMFFDFKKRKKKSNRPFQMVIYPSPPIITKGAIITNLLIMVTGTLTIMYNPLFKIYTTSVWFDPINFQQMS